MSPMARGMAVSPESDRTPDPGSHHWASAGSESRVAGRLASIGLLLVLMVLTGFAVVSALRTDVAATAVARSTGLNDAYWHARYAVGAEESLERKYRIEPGPAVRVRFDDARRVLRLCHASRRPPRDGRATVRSRPTCSSGSESTGRRSGDCSQRSTPAIR